MRKLVAILLIGIHLLTTTELSEFLKLPSLVTHFAEHKSADQGVTFFDFLHMHYAHDISTNSDFDHDKKLPFKSHEGCVNLNIFQCLPAHPQESFQHLIPECSNEFHLNSDRFIPSAFLASIWQPPKSC